MAAPHRAHWRKTAVFVSVALLSGGCMSNAAPSEASLTGTATYRDRIALPPGAVVEATLEDVTRADAPAEVLGRTRIDSPGNPPVADGQREPHFILQPEQKRVTGSGGCNRLAGSYALEGETLVFSQMAGTRMACPQGMDVEQAFYAALGKVATWRIDGETLELFDASGTLVTQFESRYMKQQRLSLRLQGV